VATHGSVGRVVTAGAVRRRQLAVATDAAHPLCSVLSSAVTSRLFEALVPWVSRLLRPQDLEQTEHFHRGRQQTVAKIVQCGEPFYFCMCLQEKTYLTELREPVTTKAQSWHGRRPLLIAQNTNLTSRSKNFIKFRRNLAN
jgi:hypothetical protein